MGRTTHLRQHSQATRLVSGNQIYSDGQRDFHSVSFRIPRILPLQKDPLQLHLRYRIKPTSSTLFGRTY